MSCDVVENESGVTFPVNNAQINLKSFSYSEYIHPKHEDKIEKEGEKESSNQFI